MNNKILKILILPIIGISLFGCNNDTSSASSSNSEGSSTESTTSFNNPVTVTFKNYDSTTIYSETIESGSIPTYNSTNPTRANDENFSYTFAGWDKEFAKVTKDTVYTAVFNKTVINDSYSTDGVSYTLSSDGTYYIASEFVPYHSGVIKSVSEVVIAKTYEGKLVKEIGANFFVPTETYALEIAYIPDSIETINANAFAYLDDFKQIVLSSNVKTIKKNAFNNCPNLCIYSYATQKPETWEEGYADKNVKTYFASQWEMVNAAPVIK